MRRFYTFSELGKMPPVEKWTTVFCIVVIQAIGIAFSIAFWQKGAGLVSIIPVLGFTILAWEHKARRR